MMEIHTEIKDSKKDKIIANSFKFLFLGNDFLTDNTHIELNGIELGKILNLNF